MGDAYDAVPYTEHAYAESHPDNLEVVARVAGWSCAPAAAGPRRVLELGCGRGGNLLPMASSWPEAVFVGVDRSAAQIRHARQVAGAAGLTNVTFDVGDAGSVDAGSEAFDFVLCHGVYSWVSVEARRAILGRVRAALTPSGVAFVSYNTLPGWYRRLAARDWIRFASQWPDARLEPKQALAWLDAAAAPGLEAYRRDLDEVRRRLLETDAAYGTHEFLSDEHHPVDVATFLAEASAADLTYLGDALPADTALELLSDPVRDRGEKLDVARREALIDFARNAAFRRTLLVRTDTAAKTAFRSPPHLGREGLRSLRVASRLTSREDTDASGLESFAGPSGAVQASGPLAAALRALGEIAPRSMSVEELRNRVSGEWDALAGELKDLWLASVGIDLHVREPDMARAVSSSPLACPVARWQAAHGGPITNRWHQEVVLAEPLSRAVLARLDGRTPHPELAAVVRASTPDLERSAAAVVDSLLQAILDLLARSALLIR